jgi:hypothetical protein
MTSLTMYFNVHYYVYKHALYVRLSSSLHDDHKLPSDSDLLVECKHNPSVFFNEFNYVTFCCAWLSMCVWLYWNVQVFVLFCGKFFTGSYSYQLGIITFPLCPLY